MIKTTLLHCYVTRFFSLNHITPILKELHWLPLEQRIEYKVLLHTFKALHGLSPVYISSLIQPYIPRRSLRSENSNLLTVPKTKTVRFGDRSFRKSSAVLWNTLPISVKSSPSISSFKTNLKTHYFKLTFYP